MSASAEAEEARVPHSFAGYLRGMGPGIVVALSWLGTGDLIDSSVSGANYGYALMWALLIATFARFFVVSALTKYQLCNSQGDQTILDGFERVWRGFPLFLGFCAVFLGLVYHCFLFIGAGTALYFLFGEVGGEYGVFMWAVVVLVIVVFLASRPNEYKGLEIVANVAMTMLVLTFIWAVIGSGIDVVAFLRGLTFDLPPQEGGFSAIVVVVSIIGAVGGSVANLMYPYFARDKGWRGPRYRRLQVYDLLFGVLTLLFLNFAIWIVAAELMRGQGETIEEAEDLARMMELAIGPLGPPLLWIAVFFTVFDNIGTQVYAFPRMAVEALHKQFPSRARRYGFVPPARGSGAGKPPPVHGSDEHVVLHPTDTYINDPVFRWLQGLLLLVPIVFTLPFGPGLVAVTVFGNAIQVFVVPAIIIGLIWMTNSRKWMLEEYANSWWENLILLVIGGIGLWATYNLASDLISSLVG